MNYTVYHEQARDIPVYAQCDILIVGGGAAGQAAAVAAARAGARDIILLERYGYLGGDVTGGYVVMIPNMSWYGKSFVRGLQEEWLTRLAKIPGALLVPSPEEVGSQDPALVHHWRAIHDCVSRGTFGGCKPAMLVRSPYYDPQYLKIVLDEMVHEHRDAIRLCYHCWGTRPIMEGNAVRGVIFESKEGRKAIMAKVVIDATGDGDLFSQTGAPYQSLADAACRSSTTALVYRVAGIDWRKWYQFQNENPEISGSFKRELCRIAGFRIAPLPTNDNRICWMNNWHVERDCTRVSDLTDTEVTTRLSIHKVIDYMRRAMPSCFGNAYLYDIAPQTGVRCSRRLQGEYVMSTEDFAFARTHDDVIAWHSTICQINDCGPVEIPYRAILPQKIEGLLCPGRHLSADSVAVDWLNLIPQCTGMGQAAGVVAAVAVRDGSPLHSVDIRRVQDILAGEQNVPLPRNSHTDKSYLELCKEHEYGLYTHAAQQAAREGEAYIKTFRQDTNHRTGEDQSANNYDPIEH